MILSNKEILNAIAEGIIEISPTPSTPSLENPESPWNTSSLDLRLSDVLSRPKVREGAAPFTYDLRHGGIAAFLKDNYETKAIDPEGGYSLQPNKFVLSNTLEKIHLKINPNGPNYAARVEGRSSFARCGLLVHFTAPTIHAGFAGPITLELMNLGANSITLFPNMPICQLIFEKVEGQIAFTPSQFQNQSSPEGT
jgi:dCTP deaminase